MGHNTWAKISENVHKYRLFRPKYHRPDRPYLGWNCQLPPTVGHFFFSWFHPNQTCFGLYGTRRMARSDLFEAPEKWARKRWPLMGTAVSRFGLESQKPFGKMNSTKNAAATFACDPLTTAGNRGLANAL